MALVESPCPPDVVGINHYVTSERFLDERLALYPRQLHGGNRRHRYVDVETVRVAGALVGGIEARLREAWQRYRVPVAPVMSSGRPHIAWARTGPTGRCSRRSLRCHQPGPASAG